MNIVLLGFAIFPILIGKLIAGLFSPGLFQDVSWPDLSAVLLWIATGPGAAFLVGKALAYFAENVAGWHKLPSWLKFVIPLVVSALLSVGANLLLGQPAILEQIAPWFAIVMTSILAWLGSQAGLLDTKRSSDYAAWARRSIVNRYIR